MTAIFSIKYEASINIIEMGCVTCSLREEKA